LAAWTLAKQASDAAKKVAAEAHEARRTYYEAVAGLASTDHEVIKLAEAFFADKMSPDMLAKRQALRATAKAEKTKLG
jgi:hypothetical protein